MSEVMNVGVMNVGQSVNPDWWHIMGTCTIAHIGIPY